MIFLNIVSSKSKTNEYSFWKFIEYKLMIIFFYITISKFNIFSSNLNFEIECNHGHCLLNKLSLHHSIFVFFTTFWSFLVHAGVFSETWITLSHFALFLLIVLECVWQYQVVAESNFFCWQNWINFGRRADTGLVKRKESEYYNLERCRYWVSRNVLLSHNLKWGAL